VSSEEETAFSIQTTSGKEIGESALCSKSISGDVVCRHDCLLKPAVLLILDILRFGGKKYFYTPHQQKQARRFV